MIKSDIESLLVALVFAGIFMGAPLFLYFKTQTKMETFNRMSKEKVTFWEAAFTDLRIEPTK